jgi:3-deoxy-D-manno-octulosonic-acid transferase
MRPHLLLYNFLLYTLLLCCAPAWFLWLASNKKVRTGLSEKLGFHPSALTQQFKALNPELPTVWLHSVSVGEFNAVRPLLETLLTFKVQVVVSTTTHTGQALAKAVLGDRALVMYCPLDFNFSLKRSLSHFKPDLLLLVETELWPNLVAWARDTWQIPVLLINGRLSAASTRSYAWLKPFLVAPMLKQFSGLYMQGPTDAERVISLGAPKETVYIMGNLKFDVSPSLQTEKVEALRRSFGFHKPHDKVLVFASTHAGEEALFAEAFIQLRKDFPALKMVLAPRHPERCEQVRKLLNNRALRYSLRSELNEQVQNLQPIVLLDTIGELNAVYALSHFAVVGGSFVPVGGHNPIEPLAAGLPVLFGPHMFHFAAIAQQCLEKKAALQVANVEALIEQMTSLLTQPEKCSLLVEYGQQLLESNKGATQHLLTVIQTHLKNAGKPLLLKEL